MEKTKRKNKISKSNSKIKKEFLLTNLHKIDGSYNIKFKHEHEVQNFITDYMRKNPFVALISNVIDGYENKFLIRSYKTMFTLRNIDEGLFELFFSDIKELIINTQDNVTADITLLDAFLQERFNSDLPFAGMKLIFIDTPLNDFFEENGDDYIKLINI